ncbi:glycosyltransferase [Deinococcus lacus]|uniref:Glycosyltransferase n=1 Tax=Deinococcus lacus TaxID=392561 RepID=A0ABW1Y8Z8_9DEIO
MTPNRTLMVSAAFGGGHHQASQALGAALQARGQAVEYSDLVDFLSLPEKAVTLGIYRLWLQRSPEWYRAFYHWTDQPTEPKILTDSFGWLGIRGLTRVLAQAAPSAVISTFPTSVALAQTVRRQRRLRLLNALVVTDYRVHHHWARPEADLILVPTEEARGQMVDWGLPRHKVEVTGIPISARFAELRGADRFALREQFGLDPHRPVLLVSGGGQGSYAALGALLQELGHLGRPVQVVIPASAQGPAVTQLGGATLHWLGYTTKFPELMAACNVLVGKAGGLTVAEALALGVPMVVYAPIPGQEEYNADFLVRSGAALWARQARDIRGAVLRALDEDGAARLSQAAREISRPQAADQAADAVLCALESGQWSRA